MDTSGPTESSVNNLGLDPWAADAAGGGKTQTDAEWADFASFETTFDDQSPPPNTCVGPALAVSSSSSSDVCLKESEPPTPVVVNEMTVEQPICNIDSTAAASDKINDAGVANADAPHSVPNTDTSVTVEATTADVEQPKVDS